MFTFILIIDQRIIHLYSLSFVYCHSPGPGQTNGQTVNKTQVYRALTRILKAGVQDSHLAKSRSPTGKSGSPTQKSWSPTNLCIPYNFSILAGSDTFEIILD